MIGIIAAMDEEIQAFKDRMEKIDEEKVVADCTMTFGTWHGKNVVLCKSGVGKTKAAMSTAILCMQQPLDMIINVGTAGGLKQDEDVLDIVISDKVVQADFDTSPIDGDAGVGLVYESDADLKAKSIEVAKALNIKYHVGMIASQDIFMAREEDYQKLLSRFPDSICSEMEAGSVGQVATSFKVPFVIVRCLSDVVHHEGNPMEFSTYVKIASVQSAKLVDAILEA